MWHVIGVWMVLNFFMGETFRVFLYDVKSGFRYHLEYLAVIFVIIAFFIIKEKRKIRMCWKIRIGKSHFLNLPPAKKSRYYKLFMGMEVLGVLLLTGVWIFSGNNSERQGAWQGDLLIGHSFSGVDEGATYTGSLEAFQQGYANGYRTFEVDILFTSDDELVLAHDWEEAMGSTGREGEKEVVPTMQEFLSAPILNGGYTPLALSDLFKLMQEYPDIWIITDTKYTDLELVSRQFNKFVETAQENDCYDVLERVIVQIYRESMYETIEKIYPFRSYIFTMYKRWWEADFREFSYICRWCVSHGVNVITMPGSLSYEKAWHIAETYGIDVYVHTINDVSAARYFLENGIRGIYTDFIKRDEL